LLRAGKIARQKSRIEIGTTIEATPATGSAFS
jgi:hypothetical protein